MKENTKATLFFMVAALSFLAALIVFVSGGGWSYAASELFLGVLFLLIGIRRRRNASDSEDTGTQE